jgi:hypothetical protein
MNLVSYAIPCNIAYILTSEVAFIDNIKWGSHKSKTAAMREADISASMTEPPC